VTDDVTRFEGETLGVVATRSAERLEICLRGELDLASCDLLTAVLAAVDLTEVNCITVDLDGLRFVDSTGVLTFLRMRTLQTQAGCRIEFLRPQPSVQRVFKTLGIEALLTA
jgi:anti-anti-sigma factor